MLGHECLTSTQLYTRVAIAKLKAIHTATHPGARMERNVEAGREVEAERAELLATLDEERDEDDG